MRPHPLCQLPRICLVDLTTWRIFARRPRPPRRSPLRFARLPAHPPFASRPALPPRRLPPKGLRAPEQSRPRSEPSRAAPSRAGTLSRAGAPLRCRSRTRRSCRLVYASGGGDRSAPASPPTSRRALGQRSRRSGRLARRRPQRAQPVNLARPPLACSMATRERRSEDPALRQPHPGQPALGEVRRRPRAARRSRRLTRRGRVSRPRRRDALAYVARRSALPETLDGLGSSPAAAAAAGPDVEPRAVSTGRLDRSAISLQQNKLSQGSGDPKASGLLREPPSVC